MQVKTSCGSLTNGHRSIAVEKLRGIESYKSGILGGPSKLEMPRRIIAGMVWKVDGEEAVWGRREVADGDNLNTLKDGKQRATIPFLSRYKEGYSAGREKT